MKQIDTKQWKEFIIKDLFTVKRPSARSQANYNDGDIPFVASGNFNNGVLKYLEPKKGEILDAGNCITVSPIDGSSFYQEDDFLGRGGAGSSIILLYNPNLNLYNGYFIATVIRTVCRKYAYSDMANKDTIGAEKIKLPVDETGNPDFSYMESYMKNLELAVSTSLTDLQSAKKSDISGTLDISSWKLFQLSELFNVQKGKRLTKADMKDGKIRFIGASAIMRFFQAVSADCAMLFWQATGSGIRAEFLPLRRWADMRSGLLRRLTESDTPGFIFSYTLHTMYKQ